MLLGEMTCCVWQPGRESSECMSTRMTDDIAYITIETAADSGGRRCP
jgi:hypothetical protein